MCHAYIRASDEFVFGDSGAALPSDYPVDSVRRLTLKQALHMLLGLGAL